MSKRKRFLLDFPWAGLTASLLSMPLYWWGGWSLWQALVLVVVLTLPLFVIQSAITATIKGGRGIWSDAATRYRNARPK